MSKRYVVGVSGGIDSVVLLDMLAMLPEVELVVAHFDHGIRDDSHEDARFVQGLAARYGLPFESRREELGPDASEDQARQRRYAFLKEIAAKHSAVIATAHHSDDLIETIAINHDRGTGWRGLAAMNSGIHRPLLKVNKDIIKAHALKRGLEWHQDSTNSSDAYLRNRLRRKLASLPIAAKRNLLELHKKQVQLKEAIDHEVASLVGDEPYSRYFFTHASRQAASEMIRHMTAGRLTRPQRDRALLAIKTQRPGSTYQAGGGVEFSFTSRHFSIKLIK